ncbi:hypothetical protein NUSPORA_00987 [Nucleospora cyclopteri]
MALKTTVCKKYLIRDLRNEPIKRTKVRVENSEDKSIQEAMVSNKVKQIYATKVALLHPINIQNFILTKKFFVRRLIF